MMQIEAERDAWAIPYPFVHPLTLKITSVATMSGVMERTSEVSPVRMVSPYGKMLLISNSERKICMNHIQLTIPPVTLTIATVPALHLSSSRASPCFL